MRVLLLAHDLGLRGGVDTFSYELAETLPKMGIEILIIAKYNKNFNTRPYIHMLYSPEVPPKDVTFYLSNMYAITSIVKRFRPDVIHDISGGLQFLPWLSRYAPVVVTVHGSPLLDDLRTLYSSLHDWIRLRLYQYSHYIPAKLMSLLIKADIKRFVFVSKTCLADTLVRLEPKTRYILKAKSTVIYNGLSLERIRSIIKASNQNFNRYDIVFAGRLMEYKGVDRLIRAFSHVVKEIHEARLHIVGLGPEYNKLRLLAKKLDLERRVIFHGWLHRDRALKLISSSALLAHPSLYESFGYVVAEAYALGKPVVAHKAPYSKELVDKVGAGLVVNTFIEEIFSDALLALLVDNNLYKKLSSRAYEVAGRLFNIHTTAKKYVEVYESVVKGGDIH